MSTISSTSAKAPIAVSLGDPAGIGPELIAAAFAKREQAELAPFAVVGGRQVLQDAANIRGLRIAIEPIASLEEAREIFASALPVLSLEGEDTLAAPSLGSPSEDGARLALASLAHTIDLALSGEASAIATAPVSKAGLNAIGHDFPGQTEYLAARCELKPSQAVMMLAGPSLRTVPVTVHCALSQVPQRLNRELIETRIRITAEALVRDFAIARPRIAVAGLNPHAGEDGTFGDEEARIIAPAIDALAKDGIDVSGPFAADAMFAAHKRDSYDAAICMYHDQALIPLKTLDFDAGVNVTLGLPIIRTSPDHGTAFDIAGKGVANPGAMIAALKMAAECAAHRFAANG